MAVGNRADVVNAWRQVALSMGGATVDERDGNSIVFLDVELPGVSGDTHRATVSISSDGSGEVTIDKGCYRLS
jgi:hypothetical protein